MWKEILILHDFYLNRHLNNTVCSPIACLCLTLKTESERQGTRLPGMDHKIMIHVPGKSVQKLTRDTLDIDWNLTIKIIAHGWHMWLELKSHKKKAYNSLTTHAIQLKSHAKSQSSMTTHATRTKFSRLSSCKASSPFCIPVAGQCWNNK